MSDSLSVREVLGADPQARLSESEYASLLRRYLRDAHLARRATQPALDVLAQFGGSAATREYAATYTDEQGRAALSRAAAETSIGDLTATLSRPQVADLLGVAPSTVSHRVTAGALLAWRVTGKDVRYPAWQFTAGRTLPHLPEVLAVVPAGTHPRMLAARMTAPQETLDGQSPAHWLACGGDPAPVLALVRDLGRE